MSAVDLARLQFATTSVYHFLVVPLMIGLALLQTRWHRSGEREYLLHGAAFLAQRTTGDVRRRAVALSRTLGPVTAVVVLAFVAWTRVTVSSLGAANDLTVSGSASSPYALRVMTVVLAVLLPVVLAYQGWTYHVFRNRLSPTVPAGNGAEPAAPGAGRPGSEPDRQR